MNRTVNKQDQIQLGLPELQRIVFLVKTRYGFDFTHYAMSSFQRRVKRILELFQFKSVAELCRKIEQDRSFAFEFIEEVTVNTTELFRDPEMWADLKTKVIPQLMVNSNIHIWHAGCSTGEEVYSMAIMLKEFGVLDRVKIVATDLNPSVIEVAKRGIFPQRALGLYRSNFRAAGMDGDLSDHYVVKDGKIHMNVDLIKNVSFRKYNLVNGEPFSKFDLIMCRNVMIYFDKVLQDNVNKLFYNSLFKNGYFAIGAKESLVWCSYAYKFEPVSNETKIFQVTI